MTGACDSQRRVRRRRGDQIDEQLENIAASVESQIGESYRLGFVFNTLKERTDEVLGAFHDVLTSPAFRGRQDRSDAKHSCAAAFRGATTTRTVSRSANFPMRFTDRKHLMAGRWNTRRSTTSSATMS